MTETLNLLITFAIPEISKGAHIGGLIGGFVTGTILARMPRIVDGRQRTGPGLTTGDIAAVGTCYVVGVLAFVGCLLVVH